MLDRLGDEGGRVGVSALDGDFAARKPCLVPAEGRSGRQRPLGMCRGLVGAAGPDEHQCEARVRPAGEQRQMRADPERTPEGVLGGVHVAVHPRQIGEHMARLLRSTFVAGG